MRSLSYKNLRPRVVVIGKGTIAIHKNQHRRELDHRTWWQKVLGTGRRPARVYDPTCVGCRAWKAYTYLRVTLRVPLMKTKRYYVMEAHP